MSNRINHLNEIKTIEVNCPLCGNSRKKLVYDKMTDVEDKMSGIYAISQCAKCHLIYLSTRPTMGSLMNCYRNDYHVYVERLRWEISKSIFQFKHRHDFGLLSKILRRIPRSLIDIGYGSGGFLLEINRRWDKKIQLAGIELEKPLTDDLSKSGIHIYTGVLEKMKSIKKYEIVTMNEILEHVYDPVLALRSAGRWLAKDGLLIGEVPDYNSPWRNVFGKYWQGFQIPRHMTFFERGTLKKVLTKAGFQVISISNRINYGDIGVSLCNRIINFIYPKARPRKSWLYIPILLITSPIIYIMDKFFHTPGILEFIARKKTLIR